MPLQKEETTIFVVTSVFVLIVLAVWPLFVYLAASSSGASAPRRLRSMVTKPNFQLLKTLTNGAYNSNFGAFIDISPDGGTLYVSAPNFETENGRGYLYTLTGDLKATINLGTPGAKNCNSGRFSFNSERLALPAVKGVELVTNAEAPQVKTTVAYGVTLGSQVPTFPVWSPDDSYLFVNTSYTSEKGDPLQNTLVFNIFGDGKSSPKDKGSSSAGQQMSRNGVLFQNLDVLTMSVNQGGAWLVSGIGPKVSTFAASLDGSFVCVYGTGAADEKPYFTAYEIKDGKIDSTLHNYADYPRIYSLATTGNGLYVAMVRESGIYIFNRRDTIFVNGQKIDYPENFTAYSTVRIAFTPDELSGLITFVVTYPEGSGKVLLYQMAN